MTENVGDVSVMDSSISLNDKITILGFLGNDVQLKKGNAFNLNQKIYKRFYEFSDFQFVMVVPKGAEDKVDQLKKQLGNLVDISKWHFVYGAESDIKGVFEGLKTDLTLDGNLATPYVFIIDKELHLRGRTDDEDEGTKYGFKHGLGR